jgi:putative colanic acid biosynthesis acetyltransferase WcaF
MQHLDQFDNSWYRHGRPLWFRLLWMFVNAVFFVNPLSLSSGVKVWLLRAFGAKVGHGFFIKPQVSIKQPWLLQMGNHVWIGEQAWIDNLGLVSIADHVCISQGALLLTGNHNYKQPSFDLIVGEIRLEEGCWVGARAVVCPGITVGRGAVLSVASVATHHLEENWIYQGNPAQKTRPRLHPE